ncbi:hypothetical protein ACSFBI_05235 [Variovorax sp. RB3P1]|uniref:hypothetical protein n=1 Tax=Variovorax sp. RB3P1 TaxID=3443732 RepID=UPI003F4883E2
MSNSTDKTNDEAYIKSLLVAGNHKDEQSLVRHIVAMDIYISETLQARADKTEQRLQPEEVMKSMKDAEDKHTFRSMNEVLARSHRSLGGWGKSTLVAPPEWKHKKNRYIIISALENPASSLRDDTWDNNYPD